MGLRVNFGFVGDSTDPRSARCSSWLIGNPAGVDKRSRDIEPARVAMEAGTHSISDQRADP